MGLMLNLGLAATPVGEVAPPAGPSVTAPGSTDNATPVVGDTVTITAGTATATGGGAVTYEFRHLVNGVSASAVAGYTYQAADDGDSFAQQWRAVETGGTNDGATGWFTVATGTVLYAPAVNTVAPVASGDTSLGDVLSVTNGTWTGAAGGAFSYQWQRGGVDIAGATASSYMIVQADDAASLRCVVTYTNSGGAVSANSNAITVDDFATPVITGVPTISGTETQGQTLTATAASVAGNPTPARTWQWERNGSAIAGATSATYVLQAADVGATLTVVQTETNGIGADSAESAATGTIQAPASAPTVTIDAFNDGTDTATITADQDCDLDWALVSGVTWSYSAGTFSGADVLESGDAGSFTVAGGAQAFTPTYTSASATATTLVIGATNANGDDTATTAFTPNLPPAAMSAPSLVVDSDTQITATLASDPPSYQNPITSYDLRYSTDEATWTTVTGVTSPHAITGLTASTLYYVQTRANNVDGAGAWSTSVSATTNAGAGGGVTPVYVTSVTDDNTFGEFKTFASLIPDADDFLVVFAGVMGGADTQAMTLSGPSVNGGANVADVETGVGSAYAGAWLITSTGASDVTIDGNDFTMGECAVHLYRVTGAVSIASDSAAGELAETSVSIASAPAGAAIIAAHCNTDTTGSADTTTWDVGDLSGQQDYLDTRSSTASLANGTTQTISTTPALSNANPGAPWATIIVSITDT